MGNNVKKLRDLQTLTLIFFKFFAFNLNLSLKNGKLSFKTSSVMMKLQSYFRETFGKFWGNFQKYSEVILGKFGKNFKGTLK